MLTVPWNLRARLGWPDMNAAIRQYLVITGSYWGFTLTDGALRMLVVLHFHQLGYTPLEIALLFIFYELFGVVTNLVGGYLGARVGLNRTMNIGLFLQIVALLLLAVPAAMLTVPWVMAAQALSGIAKDLNKMSAKSGIKLLVPDEQQGTLYKWVAILTGSKNTLKGMGFFLGGVLLMAAGFKGAVIVMAVALSLVWLASLFLLGQDLGKSRAKPRFREILSKSRVINVLSAARMFLFGARDVWFVVALPVYMASAFGWDHWQVGGFMASWVIGYGLIQTIAPRITGHSRNKTGAVLWAAVLAVVPAVIAGALMAGWPAQPVVIGGLLLFGVLFAINSSLHSYLIVSYARGDGVSLDVGFYYMSNASGRLLGTVLSGWVYQAYGLEACLWVSASLVAIAALLSVWLPDSDNQRIEERKYV